MKYTKMLGWLVMAAALSFTGCSSEDNLAQEPTTQQPTETATKIHVSVGAGIDNATTRSAVDYTNGVRTLQFTTGDKLYVWGHYGDEEYEPSGAQYYRYIVAGYLALDTQSFDASDPTNATFTGDLTVYRWVNEVGSGEGADYIPEIDGYYDPVSSSGIFSTADPLGECNDVTGTLIHEDAVKDVDYVIYEGDRMVYYMPDCAATVEELMTTKLWVSGDYDSGTKSFALEKDRNQPIVNCTISGLEAGVNYKVDYIYGTTAAMSDHTKALYSSMTATGGTLSFAFIAETDEKFHGIRLTNTADANDTYTVSIGQKTFTSKVYNLSRYWYGGAMHRLVDLGNVNTSTHPDGLTLQDGDAVTGLLNGNNTSKRLKISIANGATVILKGVDIRGYYNGDSRYNWAGLNCAGDATIILADGSENTVKGFQCDYPGIFIAEGKTLTIQGSGSLTASPYDGGTNSSFGAGIGGANRVACGNIVIEGGDITAKGGRFCAGIGSGANVSCGNISISGNAHVTATGGNSGAGIGSGYGISTYPSTCGNISISGNAHVTATGGNSGAGIGSGCATGSNISTCGNITISGSANVKATGLGAGIGSGYYGTVSGTISIEGGTVDATTSDAYSSGIGSGNEGSCGAIVIGSGITQVIATKIGKSCDIIGAGYNGSCGTVTIDGVVGATTSSTFEHLTSIFTNSNKTWTLTHK